MYFVKKFNFELSIAQLSNNSIRICLEKSNFVSLGFVDIFKIFKRMSIFWLISIRITNAANVQNLGWMCYMRATYSCPNRSRIWFILLHVRCIIKWVNYALVFTPTFNIFFSRLNRFDNNNNKSLYKYICIFVLCNCLHPP